ncbi:MAG: cobalamin B12-binding domain-containing protein [Cypionkella sp.]|nr:cobalamin B12-binding domain-containing protein [Cypionkella sp.]
MSGPVILHKQRLEIALSEADQRGQLWPEPILVALAKEVVSRVAKGVALRASPELKPSNDEIDKLCNFLLSDDPSAAANFIEKVQMRGGDFDTICIQYLSVAAQRLGSWWEQDRVSFFNVTIGAGRIYAILRILRRGIAGQLPDLRRAAVFAAVPGENHTLGITMAADMARDRQWDIELFVGLGHDALLETLIARQPPIIALSAGGTRSLPALVRLMVALHIAVPSARVLVCGQIVALNLVPVGVAGADAVAADFESALHEMERFLPVPNAAPKAASV